MLELKHVPLHKGFADFLVGPCDKKLVIVVGFFCETSREVDGGFKVHPLPARRQGEQSIENLSVTLKVRRWQTKKSK